MDFCPECGGLILNGTKCNICGYNLNGFNFRDLKIGVPSEFILDKSSYKKNYDALLGLILNKNQANFTKQDILENYNKIIDIANENFINNEKMIISREFTNEINSRSDFIDENQRLFYKSKYNKDYFPYYDILNFEGKINSFNFNFMEKREKEIYSQFKKDLKFINKPLTDEEIEKFKIKFTEHGYDFFTNLDMEKEINEKLIVDAFNIIRNEYGDSDSLISKEKLSELKSNYPYFEWDIIVKKYNMPFDKKFEPHKTTDDVYYLHDYIIKDNWKYSERNKVIISKKILNYKNGVNNVVIDFTNELIEFLEKFIEYGLDNGVKQIFLVSVPSSTQSRDKNSSIKKTINIIVDKYEKGLFYTKNAQIIDLNELLYRKIDIISSHKKRQTYKVHMKTIGLNKNKLENTNEGIFILLDDITTTGNILNACADILINNGVDSGRIYKIVIAATD